jgi:methyltransferase (TIGR00027 family)
MPEREGLAGTAFGVAAARAAEHARPDRLFADPLADRLLDAAGAPTRAFWSEGPGARLAAALGDHVALRTRFFDGYLSAAGCRQVVLVAAGLDTRAYRLDWPAGTRLFELDQAPVLDFKESVLATCADRPRCDRVALAVDLRTDWAPRLTGHGFHPGTPTAWLVEGLLVYLSAAEADRLLATIGALSAPGSRLAVEHVTRPRLRAAHEAGGGRRDGALGLLASLWRNDSSTDPVRWLTGHGWQARRHDLVELAATLGRPVPPVFDPRRPETARLELLTASREGEPE